MTPIDFDKIRMQPIQGRKATAVWYDDLVAMRDLYKNQAVVIGVDVSNTQPARYGLHELWPYRQFVRPIYKLATPHLANIIEYFNNPQRFYTNSKGRKRTIEETNQLFERVAVVKRVYNQRMQDEERVEKIRVESVKRRINDHKIKIQGLRTRHSQMFNEPDTQDYQAELTALHTLLVDIQLAFNLT